MAARPIKNGRKTAGPGRKATQFKQGNPGGPGRPKGSRNKLGEDVLGDFCALWDFARLQKLAAKNPALFIKLAVSLIPKQIELDTQQTLYVIGDRPLSADEWADQYATKESGMEPAGRSARSPDKVPASRSVLRGSKRRRKD